MATYAQFLGENLVSHDGEVTSDVLYDCRYVALYFGAEWDPNTATFTQELADFYNWVNQDAKQFEVILISGDDTQEAFERLYAEHPWLTVKYDAAANQELFAHYDIIETPCLMLIDRQMEILSKNMVQDIRCKGKEAFENMKFQFPSPTKELE